MELALIVERRRHKALMWATLSAASPLADKQRHHEASKLALALAELALANGNAATRQPNKLRRWRNWHLQRSNVAVRQQCKQ